MTPTHAALIASAIFSLALASCDTGSRSKIDAVDTDTCKVELTSREDGFKLEMGLKCEGPDHTKCYTITSLRCGEKAIPLGSPTVIKGCPGGVWCVDACKSVEAPGHLWDTPEVLAQSGCNVYENKK